MRLRYRRSRMRWLCATTAPWALAAGLLVSFTASASNNVEAGVSFSVRIGAGRLTDSALIPPVGALLGALPPDAIGADILRSLPQFHIPPSAMAPGEPLRADRKAEGGPDPVVDRQQKGDLRRVHETHVSLSAPGSRLLFTRDENVLPPTVLMEGKLEDADREHRGFEPWQAPELTTTRQATSIQSPLAAAAGSTGAAASSTTPSVRRAVVLSSTTPAASDSTPVVIAAAPVSRIQTGIGITSVGRDDERPRYAELIDPDNLSKEQRCLAEAVYFEARSEPPEGQAAVAQVVLNRMKSGLYPSSICGVVYQNRNRHLACQFTFACEGKTLRTNEADAWEQAKDIASAVLEGKTYLAEVGGATHYHAKYVRPYWAKRLKKMDVIGQHIFYKLRPGQT